MIIDGTLNNAFRAPNPKNYFHFDIVVTDAFGASTPPKRVTWTITNNPPAFRDPLGCAPSVRISRPALGVNNPYPLCDVSATDPEGNVIVNYRFLSGVNGLSIDSHTGVISGAPTEAGLHTITIEAEDEFGAIGSASYNLKVNTYCGDKVYQGLNDEGETEDCDHTDNIASGPVDSAVDRQYQCSSACRYMGGYCGDGRLQVLYGEECDDGNRTPGDWCDEACQKESVCGDGVKEGIYEECDDGNTQDCDGCSHLCEVELNSTCVDNPPALPAAPFYDSSHPQSSCGPNTRSAACAGAPANALWNTVSFGLVNSFFINQTWNCTAGKWLPSNRGLYGGPSDIHCRFVCGPGYDYDSVNGVCVRRCCIFDASAFDCFICL
ncbi:DUF4215 domain-containing protein [Candidatus Parcubacteria bacterium]|nr:MAG: DUF4215 domain-containing protein [Candidatus Parcubacteria bacterium]